MSKVMWAAGVNYNGEVAVIPVRVTTYGYL